MIIRRVENIKWCNVDCCWSVYPFSLFKSWKHWSLWSTEILQSSSLQGVRKHSGFSYKTVSSNW